MKREILFRGKDIGTGEWVYGYYSPAFIPRFPDFIDRYEEHGGVMGTVRATYEVDPATVGQYTGLTDKNGVKIFEGDIVIATFINHVVINQYTVEISWGKSAAWVLSCLLNGIEEDWWAYEATSFEVIGNIHDNPELIKRVAHE